MLQFYLHPWLLHLLPAPVAVFALRRAWVAADARWRIFDSASASVSERLSGGGEDGGLLGAVLFPAPAREALRAVVRVERRVLTALPSYVDQLVAAAFILGGILVRDFTHCFAKSLSIEKNVWFQLLLGASLFLSLELYAEALHITRGAGALVVAAANSSAFHHLNSSLHNATNTLPYQVRIKTLFVFWNYSNIAAFQDGFEGVLESVHLYGRDFISSTVLAYLGDISDASAAAEMTEKLLLLWDRLYQYWLSRKKVRSSSKSLSYPLVSSCFLHMAMHIDGFCFCFEFCISLHILGSVNSSHYCCSPMSLSFIKILGIKEVLAWAEAALVQADV